MKSVEEVARAIAAHKPNKKIFDHVVIGLDKPLAGSPTGLTWRDVQRVAKSVLKR